VAIALQPSATQTHVPMPINRDAQPVA